MKAANKDGWIEWKGGKCPVEKGVRVDVRYRNGEVSVNQPALERGKVEDTWAESWDHDDDGYDIMAYRLHKPDEQVETVKAFGFISEAQEKLFTSSDIVVTGGPLEWRDRITTIDFDIHSLTNERAELVQKLASEGLQLLDVEKPVAQPIEDMSDWRNWRDGDLLECVSFNCEWTEKASCKIGGVYLVDEISEDEEHGLHIYICGMYTMPSDFKFHTRPAK